MPLMLLGGCDKIELDNDKLIAEAKSAIAKELADPASAQFKSVHVPSEAENRLNSVVCGEVLGKFKSGKQGDSRVFVYAKSAGFAGIEELPAEGETPLPGAIEYQKAFTEIWQSSCMTE
jgi:hypothetical protein